MGATAQEGARAPDLRLTDGQWACATFPYCVIIGGGWSLTGFDWGLLHGLPHVIAINRAFKDVVTADLFFTEDVRVVQRWAATPAWEAFKGIKAMYALTHVHRARGLKAEPSLYVIDRVGIDKHWSLSLGNGLGSSASSGAGAINLAEILGAKRIYLFGFDARSAPGEKYTANYHDEYKQENTPDGMDWRTPAFQCDSFGDDFTHWVAPNCKAEIYNVVNPKHISALDCWPTISFNGFCDLLFEGKL